MKAWFVFTLGGIIILMGSCGKEKNDQSSSNDWSSRVIHRSALDSLDSGSSYLSIYSEIYERHENETFGLTVTVSIRNMSPVDSLFINQAIYYDTYGHKIKSYLTETIFLKPLETIEIVIESDNNAGGTGGNFIFDWAVPTDGLEPLFEAIMISTHGQQGISFTTTGKRIK